MDSPQRVKRLVAGADAYAAAVSKTYGEVAAQVIALTDTESPGKLDLKHRR